jgi:hypothetical protein
VSDWGGKDLKPGTLRQIVKQHALAWSLAEVSRARGELAAAPWSDVTRPPGARSEKRQEVPWTHDTHAFELAVRQALVSGHDQICLTSQGSLLELSIGRVPRLNAEVTTWHNPSGSVSLDSKFPTVLYRIASPMRDRRRSTTPSTLRRGRSRAGNQKETGQVDKFDQQY